MNKVFLIGNLTKDPELRVTTSGKSVCSFSIAVRRSYASQNGERITDFINIVVWGKNAENCAKFLAKGRKVAVVGEMQNRSYEGKDGVKRTITEVQASDVEFLTPRGEQSGGGYTNDGDSAPQYGGGAPQGIPESFNEPDGFVDIDDDDLPF